MKEFFNKYKIYIIIGVVLLTILFVLLFLSKEKVTQDGYLSAKEKIQSPYPIDEEAISVDVSKIKIDIPKEERILKVSGFDTDKMISFVNNFYNLNLDVEVSEYLSIPYKKNSFILFSPITGVLTVTSTDTIPINFKILSHEDVKTFLTEYFDIESIELRETSKENQKTEYKGVYVFDDIKVGSSYLDEYSFIITTNSKGFITQLSLLLLNRDNLIKYEYLPLAPIDKLVVNSKYPKMLGSSIIEDRYYENPAKYSMKEYIANDIQLTHIFNDIGNGLLLPTYILTGDGRIIAVTGDTYWTKTKMFVCAVDPSYLTTRVIDENDALYEEGFEEEGQALY
jgi:hypothetical protein